jgi:pilus assembly protein CpaE
MYPLKVILIGIDAALLLQVREELLRRQVRIESEQHDAASAVDSDRRAAEWTGTGDSIPRLLVIHLASSQEFDELRRLRGAFPAYPILALLDGGDDPTALITIMREGATQVVLLPVQAEDFKAALDAIAHQYVPSTRPSRVLAVSGVTGGSGATTLALNLAYELASERQIRCLLVDLSLQMGMLASYLNIEPQSTIHDVLRDIPKQGLYAVQKGLTPVANNLKMIAGPYQAIKPMEVKAQDVLATLQFSKRLAELVVLDVPSTYDNLYFNILTAADQVVLVAEQRVPSIRAVKLICDRLACETTFATPHLVINRYNPRLKGFTLDELAKLLSVSRLSGIASDEAAVTAAVNNGRPLRQEAPQSRALADIDALGEILAVGERIAQPSYEKNGNVFGRLVRAFGLV